METDTKVPASAGGCSLDSLVGLAEKRVETHRNVKLARQTLREAVTALELAMARMAEADMLYQQSSQSNEKGER